MSKSLRQLRGHVVPPPAAEQSALRLDDGRLAEVHAHYLMPLSWSLHFMMTNKEWAGFRKRVQQRSPNWAGCTCPNKCKANTLDENWNYDRADHKKTFVEARFICPGCHWLKSPAFRVKSWTTQAADLPGVSSKPPHIIACLGWTEQQVADLREGDLRSHRADRVSLNRLEQQVKEGHAKVFPETIDRLPAEKIAQQVKPGQALILPWRIDLSALRSYGYSGQEIQSFEQRMYELAAQRMLSME
jgi:hypothetical protein